MAATSRAQTAMIEKFVAGWLTQDEFSVLEAVCETLLPTLEPPEGSSEAVAAYYRRSALDLSVAPGTRTEASKTLLLSLTFEHIFVIILLLGDILFLYMGRTNCFLQEEIFLLLLCKLSRY